MVRAVIELLILLNTDNASCFGPIWESRVENTLHGVGVGVRY